MKEGIRFQVFFPEVFSRIGKGGKRVHEIVFYLAFAWMTVLLVGLWPEPLALLSEAAAAALTPGGPG